MDQGSLTEQLEKSSEIEDGEVGAGDTKSGVPGSKLIPDP